MFRKAMQSRVGWVIRWASALFLMALGIFPRSAAADAERSSSARLVTSSEPGWPQWRGPRRDGICDETGLLLNWPEGGPRLLWKTNGLGGGYSAPILTGGRLFLAGDVGEELRIFALDFLGRRLWQATNGEFWKEPFPGSRASCTVHGGRLFHLNAHGRLACLDPATGREHWAVNVLERFGGKNITWALSECLLVDGPRVIVTPGGEKALMAALDVRTGETVWTTEPLRGGASPSAAHQRVEDPAGVADNASYSSPILFTQDGRRQLVSCSLRHVFGVDAETGKLLWTHPMRTRHQVIAMAPVLVNGGVFVTAPDTPDAALLRIRFEGDGVVVEQPWITRLDTCHGGVVVKDGALYGSWYRARKGWACVDGATGEVRYETDAIAKGSVLYADGRLYCLAEDGEMCLVKPTASGFEFNGRFRLVPERKSDVWTHPVIHEGRLYLRYHETLFCYDVQARRL